ncbi:unnamed protein product [Heligmosomoides polygyrus]|uniref:RING-type domain-containing protein n=1 Tax=Heligmosomoides polygyrus TaxID=6339 RepID=A0A3P8CD75_HELPZ|nr:unnamed protein product [Heligmosomoides polygyrus]
MVAYSPPPTKDHICAQKSPSKLIFNRKKVHFSRDFQVSAIDSGDGSTDALRSFSKTSVLFVSISFIILMVISLAWLVFYYVQRFRYAHAKDRLQRRLFNAARKALMRIPTRCLKVGDPELDIDCAVCIDPYQTGDVVRTLPCRRIWPNNDLQWPTDEQVSALFIPDESGINSPTPEG